MTTLEVIFSFRLKGSGSIAPILSKDNYLILFPKPGTIMKIDINENSLIGKEEYALDFDSTSFNDLKGFEMVHTKSGIKKSYYNSMIVGDLSRIVQLSDGGVFDYSFNADPFSNQFDNSLTKSSEYSVFNLTCCGIDINCNANLVAVGDFSGRISVFSVDHILKEYGDASMRPVLTHEFVIKNVYFLGRVC
jgi:hypothetical protein